MDPYLVLGVDPKANQGEIRRAYIALARRWHPDRFQDGPERLWAEQKMIEINIAFDEALRKIEAVLPDVDELTPEAQQLADVRELMDAGQLIAARRALMKVATRSAEWNYLFGAVLLRLGESEKAVLYFGIASRQRPENAAYRTALLSAEVIRDKKTKKNRSPLKKMITQAKRAFL